MMKKVYHFMPALSIRRIIGFALFFFALNTFVRGGIVMYQEHSIQKEIEARR